MGCVSSTKRLAECERMANFEATQHAKTIEAYRNMAKRCTDYRRRVEDLMATVGHDTRVQYYSTCVLRLSSEP